MYEIVKRLVSFENAGIGTFLFATALFPAMAIFLKRISQKRDSTKNELRGPDLFKKETGSAF